MQKKQYNSENNSKKKYMYCEREVHEVSDCFQKQRGEPPGGKSSSEKKKGQKDNKLAQSTVKAHTTIASEEMWMVSNC